MLQAPRDLLLPFDYIELPLRFDHLVAGPFAGERPDLPLEPIPLARERVGDLLTRGELHEQHTLSLEEVAQGARVLKLPNMRRDLGPGCLVQRLEQQGALVAKVSRTVAAEARTGLTRSLAPRPATAVDISHRRSSVLRRGLLRQIRQPRPAGLLELGHVVADEL